MDVGILDGFKKRKNRKVVVNDHADLVLRPDIGSRFLVLSFDDLSTKEKGLESLKGIGGGSTNSELSGTSSKSTRVPKQMNNKIVNHMKGSRGQVVSFDVKIPKQNQEKVHNAVGGPSKKRWGYSYRWESKFQKEYCSRCYV